MKAKQYVKELLASARVVYIFYCIIPHGVFTRRKAGKKGEIRMVQAKKTAAYRVIAGPGGKRVFRFYCDISGELCCVTKSIRADTEDEALEIAWETEGRWAFDRCPQCGRYVSSAMFNINAERCLDCAPWENEYPVFCHHCGIRLKDPDAFFCPACGARLLVGGTEEEEGRTE